MEMKFEQIGCRHLRRVVDQVQTQEQTQEVRLPESMPDIGRVLGAWGQVIVRSKEWRSSGMAVSGGVMACAMYAPEDGSEPRSVECWIPFNLKWEFPETKHDGFICVMPRLKAIDARSTSARKMMVRANISIKGQGLESVETEVFAAGEVPEDVQLLKAMYPMELPCESGEKMIEITEEPEGFTGGKILRCDVMPEILEQKVMASRLVFRGKAMVHILCLKDGKVESWDCELPFSQYADLDREFSSGASAQIHLMMTNLEAALAEGRLQIKCSLAAQYVIYDRCMMELVEDAYSPMRNVQLQKQELQLPARLDVRTEKIPLNQTIHAEAEQVVDAHSYMDHPVQRQLGENVQMDLSGMMQVLYYDHEGILQCSSTRFQQEMQIPSDPGAAVEAVIASDPTMRAMAGQDLQIDGETDLQITAHCAQGQWMVTGLTLGERMQPDENRPSLILRRCTDAGLWALAKESGSTVEAIQKANGLTEEPEKGRMLLIPVC